MILTEVTEEESDRDGDGEDSQVHELVFSHRSAGADTQICSRRKQHTHTCNTLMTDPLQYNRPCATYSMYGALVQKLFYQLRSVFTFKYHRIFNP